MTSPHVHWFVLGGGLSPYTLALWERLAERSGHTVTLAYNPREPQSDFAHEGDFVSSKKIELVPVQSLRAVIELGLRCLRARRAVVVCMGYSPVYNVAISLLSSGLRRIGHAGLLLYMSDTNGIAQVERTGSSRMAASGWMLKRAILGGIFVASLDLGFSNALAHRMLGIRKGIDLPLLPIEFPAAMEPEVAEPLASRVHELPQPRLLTVARLVKSKNLVELAKGLVAAIHEGMPGSLTIVGEGPERARLEPVLSQVPGRAILAGPVPFNGSRRLFGAFDGMVLPSTYEPWGIVITEGLGWGLPVLSSRQCGAGFSMALEAGDAVRLCGTSREELRASLHDFVRDLERHTSAARRAAPRIREKFGMTGVADALIRLANSF